MSKGYRLARVPHSNKGFVCGPCMSSLSILDCFPLDRNLIETCWFFSWIAIFDHFMNLSELVDTLFV